ncbi:MAG: hypothetical protein GC168_07755 [Candidatus Hydrogenedens sp.]|nr:hypothetical protein [Candidatus Hydrogenedens sp.]
MNRFAAFVFLTLSPAAFACGWSEPCRFIVADGSTILHLPAPSFVGLATDILRDQGCVHGLAFVKRPDKATMLQHSVDTDLQDLARAISNEPESLKAAETYRALRQRLQRELLNRDAIAEEQRYKRYDERTEPEALNTAPFEALPELVPAEFRLYFQGAVAYHAERYEEAVAAFEAVLALPEAERQHRSTWAAFMLGKTWERLDPQLAIPFYEQTRQFAEAGFEDALGLAAESRGWEGRAALKAGLNFHAFEAYLDVAETTCDTAIVMHSMELALGRVFDNEEELARLAADPLYRKFGTAFALSSSHTETAQAWLSAVEGLPLDSQVEGADHLACIAYRSGDFDAATRWLARAQADSPWTLWVQAKLALRDGRMEEAKTMLHQALAAFGNWGTTYIPGCDSTTSANMVNGDLALLYLRDENATEAFARFESASFGLEAAYVAQHYMTTDELARYIDAHEPSPQALPVDVAGWLQSTLPDILARRLAREGRWNEAAPRYTGQSLYTYDAEPLDKAAEAISEKLSEANNASLPAEQRAEAYMAAADTLEQYGRNLLGDSAAPDYAVKDGWLVPALPFVNTYPKSRTWSCQPYKRPAKRYRYFAAAWMWEASRMLPDNDARTASALYHGGKWLAPDDPKAADKFYKALVRRNPNFLIAQEADELRWFPSEFTDEAVYTSVRHDTLRKRDVAAVLLVVAPLLALLAGTYHWQQCRLRDRQHSI